MRQVFKTFFTEIFQDSAGGFSSKRTVTFYALILVSIGFFANLFGGYKVDQFIFEAIMFIVVAGLGFTGAEKFAPQRMPSPTDILPPSEPTPPPSGMCPSCGATQ